MTRVLLLSTYELGHQPLGLARPAAHLIAAGHEVACQDLAVEHLDEARVRTAEFVGISVPMHTATRLGVAVGDRVRRLNPRAHLCYYGLYASLNAATLLARGASSVVGGELETPLVELVNSLGPDGARPDGRAPAGVISLAGGEVFVGRQALLLPRRDLLPPLERYARLDDGTQLRLAGYVEASRGCAHRCLHCPITPVYAGRLRVVQEEIVLQDIRQLVALGAEHLTFGDPDFFNGVRHSMRLVRALHAEYPELSYDVTIKVEHLLEHRDLLPVLRETGCAFVVSAVEAIDDQILANLHKGHTAADVERALDLAADEGLVVRPTFLPFTPWTTLASYLDLLAFLERRRLIRHVDPVQLAIRLLVPSGSSLLGTPQLEPSLGAFDPATFTHLWQHPDPAVDALQREVAAIVEASTRNGEDAVQTFTAVKAAAYQAGGQHQRALEPVLVEAGPVPRLTEPWFC